LDGRKWDHSRAPRRLGLRHEHRHPTTAEVFERCESGFVSDATNNRAEMLALLMGLQAIEAPAFVTVHTDSRNLISGWARRCSHRVNADLWQALLVAAEPHTLTWEKVEGHTGVELNEECDKLAGIASYFPRINGPG